MSNLPGTTFGTVLTFTLIRKNPSKVMHLVFDSYLEQSLKAMEREKHGKHGVIHLAKIEYNAPIPQKMSKFWASDKNKALLQKFTKDVLLDLRKSLEITVVASGVVDDGPTLAKNCSSAQNHVPIS